MWAPVPASNIKKIEILERMHLRGLIHGDLKPHNIALTCTSPNTATIYLINFGLSRKIKPSTNGGSANKWRRLFEGTPYFASIKALHGYGKCFAGSCAIFTMSPIRTIPLQWSRVTGLRSHLFYMSRVFAMELPDATFRWSTTPFARLPFIARSIQAECVQEWKELTLYVLRIYFTCSKPCIQWHSWLWQVQAGFQTAGGGRGEPPGLMT